MQAVISSAAWPIENGRSRVQHSFTMQYTALILTILSCIIGAFARDALRGEPASLELKPTETETLEVLKPQSALGSLEVPDLFAPGLADPELDKLSGVLEFLRSHDTGVEILVFPENGQSENEAIGLSLARSISLFRYFVAQGIPAADIRSRALSRGAGLPVSFSFFREDGA